MNITYTFFPQCIHDKEVLMKMLRYFLKYLLTKFLSESFVQKAIMFETLVEIFSILKVMDKTPMIKFVFIYIQLLLTDLNPLFFLLLLSLKRARSHSLHCTVFMDSKTRCTCIQGNEMAVAVAKSTFNFLIE